MATPPARASAEARAPAPPGAQPSAEGESDPAPGAPGSPATRAVPGEQKLEAADASAQSPEPEEPDPLAAVPESPETDDFGPEPGALGPAPPARFSKTPGKRLELGATAGLGGRRSRAADLVDYGVGKQWGGFARVEVKPWLQVRLSAATELLEVGVADGFGAPDVEQPRLRGTRIGLLAEPSWQPAVGWSTWWTFGAVWERLSAAPFETEPSWASVPRSGVLLELPLGVGASVDVAPDRLRLSASAYWSFLTNQTGDLFERSQAIDNAGQLAELPGLPRLDGAFGASLYLGILL